MSTFTATCKPCDLEFDYEGSWRDSTPHCPTCNGVTQRIIACAVPHALKGSGWYQDGYSHTVREYDSIAARADRKGKGISFPGQKVKG